VGFLTPLPSGVSYALLTFPTPLFLYLFFFPPLPPPILILYSYISFSSPTSFSPRISISSSASLSPHISCSPLLFHPESSKLLYPSTPLFSHIFFFLRLFFSSYISPSPLLFCLILFKFYPLPSIPLSLLLFFFSHHFSIFRLRDFALHLAPFFLCIFPIYIYRALASLFRFSASYIRFSSFFRSLRHHSPSISVPLLFSAISNYRLLFPIHSLADHKRKQAHSLLPLERSFFIWSLARSR
jgi:hypothetical protein